MGLIIEKRSKMKIFAALTIAAVRVECAENELCQMAVRKRGGVIKKVYGSCKEDLACRVNRHQNFAWRRQCKPEQSLDENGAKVFSVCRSCSDTPWEQKKSAGFSTEKEWLRNLLL